MNRNEIIWVPILIIILFVFFLILNHNEAIGEDEDIGTYNNYTERYNQALACGQEYNEIVDKLNELNNSFLFGDLSEEYSTTKYELIEKSRECEGLWFQAKFFLEDNRKIIESMLTDDYYEEITSLETRIKWYQENRQHLMRPLG